MRIHVYLVIFMVLSIGLTACSSLPEPQSRLRLPQGDRLNGQATFVELQCHACHGVGDLNLPKHSSTPPTRVQLGGWYVKAKTYEELITAIIHPSHELIQGYDEDKVAIDGESMMPNYNNRMTVKQLIDIVEFLQTEYEILPPVAYAKYDYFGP